MTFPNLSSGWPLGGVAAIGLIALALLHRAAFFILGRLARRSSSALDDTVVKRLYAPTLWLILALVTVAAGLPLEERVEDLVRRSAGLLLPALFGWLALVLLSIGRAAGEARADISVADNLRARRRRTRIGILHRIAVFVVVLLTACLMLLSIPSVRSIGVTLIASAGLAGLAIGAAAQPALKNLIAGVQMAFTEPIRLDDVVIMDGEWGRIEEIRLTYVVVRIWDDRRLIVPVSKFLESSFENWTRETSAILGTAFIYVDPAADVAQIRAKVEEIVGADPNWDGRVVGVQVTDLQAEAMQLRALVSAADAGKAFDLRCAVREGVMAWLSTEMPEALARQRRAVAITPAGEPPAARR